MSPTVLVTLAAVIVLIAVVVWLGMRYLRADDEEEFDDGAQAEHGRFRSRIDHLPHDRSAGHDGPASERSRQRPDADRDAATGRSRADRGWADGADAIRSGVSRDGAVRDGAGRSSASRSSASRSSASRDGSSGDGFGRAGSSSRASRSLPGRRGSGREADLEPAGLDSDWSYQGGRDDRTGRGTAAPRDDRDGRSASRRDRADVSDPALAGVRAGRGSAGRDGQRGTDEFDGRGGRAPSGGRAHERDYDRDGDDSRERREARDGRDSWPAGSRDAAGSGRDERRGSTRPNARPDGRRNGSAPDREESLPAVRPRQGRGKRDGGDGDWPSNEWDELSDVDYWAELASDKPLPAAPAPAAQSARPDRGEPRPDVDSGLARGDRPRGDRSAADRNGSDRNGSDRNGSDRNGSDRNGSDRNGSDIGADRGAGRDTGRDTGRDATRTPASSPARVPDKVAASSRGGDPAYGARGEDFAGPSPRRAAAAGNDQPPLVPPVWPVSSGSSRPVVQPADDDPLTSPSFPRIEADDSRSYRRSRSSSGEYSVVSRSAEGSSHGSLASGSQAQTQQYSAYSPSVPQGQPLRGLDSSSQPHSYTGPASPDYAAAAADPYRSVPSSTSASNGYPVPAAQPGALPAAQLPAARLPAAQLPVAHLPAPHPPAAYLPAGQAPVTATNGDYRSPVTASYPAPPAAGTGSYSGYGVAPAASSAAGSYSAPASVSGGYPASPGYPDQLPPGNVGYRGDLSASSYPAPVAASGSYPAPVAASGPYPAPTGNGGYPAGTASYPATAATSSYSVPAAGYLPGAGDPAPSYQRYGQPGPAAGSVSQARSDASYGYGTDQRYQPGGQAVPGYPAYPAPDSTGYQVPGVPGPAGGYGADYAAGQTQPAPVPGYQPGQYQAGQYQGQYQDGQYQDGQHPAGQNDPLGYPTADTAGYAGADPYAMDPYGYTGYGSNGYQG